MNSKNINFFCDFPYLDTPRNSIKEKLSSIDSFDDFLNNNDIYIKNAIKYSIYTIRVAIGTDKENSENDCYEKTPTVKFLAYYFSKLLLNSSKYTKKFIAKYAEFMAEKSIKSYTKIKNNSKVFKDIKKELKFTKDDNTITVIDYIPISTILKSENQKYKLINMSIDNGIIKINDFDKDKFFKAYLIHMITKNLKMVVNNTVKQMLVPYLSETFDDYYDNTITDYGELSLPDYPPCILNLIHALNENKPLTHPARFALVTFCHKTGMEDSEIAKLFSKSNKFNLNTTMYQIRHITGQEGADEYIVPACDTLKTNGVCVSNEGLCKRVKHPLGYYIIKKGLYNKNKDDEKPDSKNEKIKYAQSNLRG